MFTKRQEIVYKLAEKFSVKAIKKLKLDFPIFETSQPLFDTGFGEDTYSKEAQEVYNKFVDLMEDLIK